MIKIKKMTKIEILTRLFYREDISWKVRRKIQILNSGKKKGKVFRLSKEFVNNLILLLI